MQDVHGWLPPAPAPPAPAPQTTSSGVQSSAAAFVENTRTEGKAPRQQLYVGGVYRGPPRTPPSPVSDSNSSEDEDTPRVLVQWRPPGIRTEGKAPRMQLGDQFCVERGLDYWFAGARGVHSIHLNDEKKRRLKEAANNATKEQVEKYAQDPLGIRMSGNRLKHDYQLAKTRASKSAVLARYAMPGWLWTNPPTAPDVDRGATGPI